MFSQGLGVGSAILSPYFASHANVGMELRTVIGSVNFTCTGSRTRASRVRRTWLARHYRVSQIKQRPNLIMFSTKKPRDRKL